MFGFFFGAACLAGLVSTVRRERMERRYGPFAGGWGGGWHGGFGGRGFGGRGFGGRGGFGRGFGHGGGFGPWSVLPRMAAELDATRDQEKVIRETARELFGKMRDARKSMKAARKGYADAIRGESLDEVALGTASAQVDESVEAGRKAWIDALAKIHGVLDERQRKLVAEWLAEGPGFSVFRGGFGGGSRRPFDDDENGWGGGPWAGRGPRGGGCGNEGGDWKEWG